MVNYDYLKTVLENYGFVQLTTSEANAFKIPDSVGSFEQLYKIMQSNIKENKLDTNTIGEAYRMTREERDISFLNNYFIYKKVRNVDIKDVKVGLIQKTEQEEIESVVQSILPEKPTETEEKPTETEKKPTETEEKTNRN